METAPTIPTTESSKRWPSQVKYILGNETAERFSYYGMKGILALYITNILLQTKDQATNVIHWFAAANYFMPLVGAWISDRIWGRYKTILWVSLLYCLGHGVLAAGDLFPSLDVRTWCLYVGLALIAAGSGGIKPCVSAFMGDQFDENQKKQLEKAFAAFYWCINIGSTAAFLIIPFIRKSYGYSWAFGIPGIAMAIATFLFWKGTKHYKHVEPTPDPHWKRTLAIFVGIIGIFLLNSAILPKLEVPGWIGWVVSFIVVAIIGSKWTGLLVKNVDSQSGAVESGATGVWMYALAKRFSGKSSGSFWKPAVEKFTNKSVDHGVSLARICGIFALVPIFWALFDQTFSTWVLQGEQMKSYMLFNYEVGPEEMLSANPIFVVLLIPLLTGFIYPRMGKWGAPLRRMTLGMFLAVISYLVVAWLQQRLERGEPLSILWQLIPYIVISIAEVLVSTTGLEFAYTQAAKEMKSMITGLWLFTVTVGNIFVVLLTTVLGGGHGDESVTSGRFMLYAGITLFVSIIFFFVSERYKYRSESGVITD